MDIVDIVGGKNTLAVSRDLDALLGREGARGQTITGEDTSLEYPMRTESRLGEGASR